jgi:hypothetical protein
MTRSRTKPRIKGKAKPVDPAEEARRRRDPGRWGLNQDLATLTTGRDVRMSRDQVGRVAAAKRLDAFDALKAAGGLDLHQHEAAQRLFRDWALMLGVAGAPEVVGARVDQGRDPGGVTHAMIMAQERAAEALTKVGPANARLLRALIEPLVSATTVLITKANDDEAKAPSQQPAIWWRAQVRLVTGESNPVAQASAVRQACENLRLVYGLGAPPDRLHPFGLQQSIAVGASTRAA